MEYMHSLSRRTLVSAPLAWSPALAKPALDSVLRDGIAQRKIPCVAAAVGDSRRIVWQGAFGTRDPESKAALQPDSIFAIASMTKAITSVAAVQLVEKGKVKLDEPAVKFLPELEGRLVLDGFGPDGRAKLRPPSKPVTLRHLLTHTSGLCYSRWEPLMVKWQNSPGVAPNAVAPLMFDPGSRWQYGTGIDLAGRLVEQVSGQTLEAYFQQNILGPLAMKDTSFILPPEKFPRLVARYSRGADGILHAEPLVQPVVPKTFNGGGGLYSTAPDYVRFMQAILKRGAGLMSRRTFDLVAKNQIGTIRAGVMPTTDPATSSAVDIHPGETDHHTLAFVVNPRPHQGGRAGGSLAWAGLFNTFYWIDPARQRCAVILMQFLPFVDREAVGLLNDFERAVYAK